MGTPWNARTDRLTRPNLFLIGAMKSGTSSMHRHLSAHPQIFMSEEKEPSFFVAPDQLARIWPAMYRKRYWSDPAKYLALFRNAEGARWIGESSTNYAKLPLATGVAERIHAFEPGARILYIMREPARRALSHYWHAVDREFEQRSPEEALVPKSDYFAVSDYARQLAPYLRLFPETSVRAITMESFERNPARVYRDLLHWLDVDPAFVPEKLEARHHETPTLIWRTRRGPIARFCRKLNVPRALRRACPASVRYYAWRLSVRPVRRDAAAEQRLVARLHESMQPGIRALESLLGTAFPEWTGNG